MIFGHEFFHYSSISDGFLCAPFANSPEGTNKKTGATIVYETYQYCRSYSASWNYRCWGTSKEKLL